MPIAGRKAQVNVSGDPVSFSNAGTTPNGDLTVFQITDTSKRVWGQNVPITVERSTDGGTTWTELDPETDGYTLDRLFGLVIFGNARNSGTEIRVSGKYLPMSMAAEATEYSWQLEADNQDSTTFQAVWSSREQGLVDFSGSISRFFQTNSFFFDAIKNNEVTVVEFYSDSAKPPDIKGWALFSSDEPDAAVDGLVEESIDYEGTTDADGRSVSNGQT